MIELSHRSWAFLSLLHRQQLTGGPPLAGFAFEYAELHENGLIVREESKVILTDAGEAALRGRGRLAR